MVSRRIAIQEAEQDIERLMALVSRSDDCAAVDEVAMRQTLQRIAFSCADIGQIGVSSAAARDAFKAAMLRPSDLRLRQHFRDTLSDLRMSVREARRALATSEWPAPDPTAPTESRERGP